MTSLAGVRALSLTRPWTWLVLHGGKNVENRVWPTTYRGPLLVHGALSRDPAAVAPFMDLLPDPVRIRFGQALATPTSPGYWTGLLGLVDVVGCCTAQLGPYESWKTCDCGAWAMPGQAHWQLQSARPFAEPIPCRGALGLWRPAPELVTAVARAVPAA